MSNELAISEAKNTGNQLFGFDISGVDGVFKVFNALNGAVSLDDAKLTELGCIGLKTKDSTMTDPLTGAERACRDTYIIGSDGTSYFSKSAGIAKSADNLIAALNASDFGGWPVGMTIKLVFKSTELAGKRTWKYFDAQPVA